MVINPLLIGALIGALAGVLPQATDTFEITFTHHGAPGTATGVIQVEADELEVLQCCTITLWQGPDAVATLQSHQVSLVVNRSAGGERVYHVFRQAGGILQVHADRMVPNQNGLVYFYTEGRLIGVTNQNAAQMVIDAGARVDRDLSVPCRAAPAIR